MMDIFAKIRFFFIIPLVCVVLFSCDPNEKLPPETKLEWEGVQFFVDTARNLVDINLQIRFQDGDGNIGYIGSDTTFNLFIHVFDRTSLTDTIYEAMLQPGIPVDPDDWVIRFAIPNLNTEGQPSVKGMLNISFGANFPFLRSGSRHGVVRFKIYMFDRDAVQSNVIITPDITIR